MIKERLTLLLYMREQGNAYRDRVLARCDDVDIFVCESEAEIERHIDAAEVLLASIYFPTQYLALAKRLKWIQLAGAGVERFTMDAALPKGVMLTRADLPSFGNQIADYVIGYCLFVTQQMHRVFENQAAKRWEPLHLSWLKDKTIGIAGLGSIGKVVAKRAASMGMRVLGFARTPQALPRVERCFAPDELLAFLQRLHFLALCLPLTRQTRGLIDAKALRAMRRDAWLINAARGEIVNEAELIVALREDTIAGAVLDVFEEEPLAPESPLWAMENVVVTPHHSGLNIFDEMADVFLDNLRRYRADETLVGLVDPVRGY